MPAPIPLDAAGQLDALQQRNTDLQRQLQDCQAAWGQERAWFQALMDNIPDTIYFKDRAGRFTRINQAQARLLGLADPAAALGQTDFDFQPAGLAQAFHAEEQLLMETGQPLVDREEYNPTPAGEPRWFSATKVPVRDAGGNVVGLVGISRDITERKQAENEREALLRRELAARARLADTLASISDGFVAFDAQMNYTYVNARGGQLLGREPQDLIGKNYWQEYPEAKGTPFANAYVRALETQTASVFEDRYAPWDRWFENRLYPSPDGLAIFFTEITERKRAQVEFQKRADQLAALRDTALDIAAQHDPAQLFQAIVERANALLAGSGGEMYECDPARREARCIVSYKTRPDYRGVTLRYGEGAAGKVAESGQALVIDDYRRWPGRAAAFDPDQPFFGLIAAPLKWQGAVTGVLQVLRGEDEARFTSADRDLLQLFADQAAVAVENARLIEEGQQHAALLQVRVGELAVIYEVARRLQRLLAPEALAAEIIELLEKTLGYEFGAVLLVDEPSRRLIPFALAVRDHGQEFKRQDREFILAHELRLGKGITGWVAEHGQSVRLGDVWQDERYYGLRRHIRSEMCAPIRVGAAVIGVVNVETPRPDAYSLDDQHLLETVATLIAVAIQNARLLDQVQRHATELEQRVAERTAELKEQYQRQAAFEERQRLARDLHDVVSQTLFSASIIAETLPRLWERDPEQVRQSLGELQRLTRGALAEMRALLLELRPEALRAADLADLLGHLANAFRGRSALEISLTVEPEPALPAEARLGLYRIAQEALNNVVKHAGAQRVEISLAPIVVEAAQGVRLRLHDDGRGFDLAQPPAGHLGLGIMRERANAIGATLTLHSQAGAGTEVVVTWPQPAGTDR